MLNFENICKQYRVAYIGEGHHHCHSGWIQIHCPFCASGISGWHLGFNLSKGNFNCWRCGTKKVWDVLIAIFPRRNKSDVMQILKENETRQRHQVKEQKVRRKAVVKPPKMEPLPLTHKKYLKRRGFKPEELVEDWELTGTKHLSGKWSHRIIIPFHDVDGHIIAYQGRALNETRKPKYKMTEDEYLPVDPQGILYGLDKVPGDSVMVVEGVADVWRLGFGAVATCGIDWKIKQANQIRKFKRRFILFDPGEQAQKKAEQLAKWLSMYSGETEIIEDLGGDPGSLSPKEALSIRNELLF